jgi:hypothetical protein
MNKKILYLSLLLIAIVQSVIFLLDRHPMFFFGDSATYLWTAITGSIPLDRSFSYGYFIHFVSLFTRSLVSVVAAQTFLTIVTCFISVHLLIRYFNVLPWLALSTGLLMTIEPLQLLYTRYIMTETLALFLFVFYVWVILQYIEDARIRWLVVMQILAVVMISVRFAFIPVVWIGALAVPMITIFPIAENEKSFRKKFIAVAIHVFISVSVLFALASAYKHAYGYFLHKPPAYSYDGGFFAISFVTPIVEPEDFKNKNLGEQVFKNLAFSVKDRRTRSGHRWLDGGIVSRLNELEPDRVKSNQIAREAAIHAVIHKPQSFLKLGWHTFTDYFDKPYLKSAMETDLGNRRLEPEFLNFIKQRFNYRSGQLSAMDLMTHTGRYFLRSGYWIQGLLFLPLLWAFLFVIAQNADQRRKTLMMGLFSLVLIGVALLLVERPTPRFLHIPAWLACMAAGVGISRIGKHFSTNSVSNKHKIEKNHIPEISGDNKSEKIIRYVALSFLIFLIILKQTVFFSPTGADLFGDELVYKQNAENIFAGFKMASAHYPPLYSILLAPSFLFKNWYDVMIILNGLVSSLLIVPVWFLARRFMKPDFAAIAALMSLMIPFQLIYPGYLLSENLFMFLFAGCVLLALQGSDTGKLQAVLFGLALAAAHLTRHIMLPAVFILSLFWMITPYLPLEGKKNRPQFRDIRLHVLLMIFFYLAIYSLWLFYTQTISIPAVKAMGFGVSNFKAPLAEIDRLTLWMAAYASYMILAVAPFLMVFAASSFGSWGLKIKKGHMTAETVFGVLLFVLTLSYFLVATNHSFSAGYNAASAKYLLGRYVMVLTPLYIVAGMMAAARLLDSTIHLKKWQIVFSILSALFLMIIARGVLHSGWIWNLPGWFADIEFNSPDAFIYKSKVITSAMAVLTMILGIVFLMKKKIGHKKAAVAVCFILVLNYMFIYAGTVQRLPVKLAGLHPRNIAPVLLNHVSGQTAKLDFYYDIPGMNERTMHLALTFWGTTFDQERIHSFHHRSEKTDAPGSFLLLSRIRYPIDALLTYKAGGKPFHLYKIDQTNPLPAPEILTAGPERIVAGESFNRLPDGSSALWMQTANATSWTVIIFRDRALPTTVESASFVTARVPDELFATPGQSAVYLKDRLSGRISNTMTIPVTSKER